MMMIMYVTVRLFPLPERGMNPHAQTLKDHEIEVITEAVLHSSCDFYCLNSV